MSVARSRLLVALLLPATAAVAQEEPQLFNAFAIVVASGTIVKAGEKQVMVIGTLKGPMFVETDEGPVDAGSVVCGASIRSTRVPRAIPAAAPAAFRRRTAPPPGANGNAPATSWSVAAAR